MPRFIFFVNASDILSPAYRKYLETRLRAESPFSGLPVILEMRGRPPRENKR